MFKNPFSFNGRIRRTEYCLSLLTIYAALIIILYAAATLHVLILLLLVPLFWFISAQGAKRCHDIGEDEGYQFYAFLGKFRLLFEDSNIGTNRYGANPKGIGNQEPINDFADEYGSGSKKIESHESTDDFAQG